MRASLYLRFLSAPWGFEHRGTGFFPTSNLTAFRASCTGTAEVIDILHNYNPNQGVDYYQVNVYILCDAANTGHPAYLTIYAVAHDLSTAQWSMGYNGSNGPGTPLSLQGPRFVGVIGEVIEARVLLLDIGEPSTLSRVHAEVVHCCDPGFTVVDQTQLKRIRPRHGLTGLPRRAGAY